MGKTIVDNLNEYARVFCGFAAIKDLRNNEHEDRCVSQREGGREGGGGGGMDGGREGGREGGGCVVWSTCLSCLV